MKRAFSLFLTLFILSCGCEKDSDCGEGQFCIIGVNSAGERAGICKNTQELTDIEKMRAKAAGWKIKAAHINIGPIGISVEQNGK